MVKLSNKWRVSARVTPDLNRSINDLVDWLKENETFKVRGRSARREHVIQLALLDLVKEGREAAAKRLANHVKDLEQSCD